MTHMDRGGVDNEGHYRCFFCNGIVIHEGADDAEDVYPECYGESDILNYLTCTECGAEYEVIQKSCNNGETPMKNELKLRKEQLQQKGIDGDNW